MRSTNRSRQNGLVEYYRNHPGMVSSPFGGIDTFDWQLWERVIRSLGLQFEGKKVLDVGCGRGLVWEYFRYRNAEYFGVDLLSSPGRMDFPFVLANGSRLPFPSACFDALICLDALEHFPSIPEAAEEFRRALKPEGCLFLSIPNYGNIAGLVKKWVERFGRYERDTWAPFGRWQPQSKERLITPGQLRKAFSEAGFTKMTYIGHSREVVLGLFPWADHPKMPDSIRHPMYERTSGICRLLARVCPTLSLHLFWRMDP